MRSGPMSSGMNVTPTARNAPDTAPMSTRESKSTANVGASACTRLAAQKIAA